MNDALSRQRFSLALAGLALALFLALPLGALFATTSWSSFTAGLSHPLVWPALQLSLLTTSASVLIVVLLGTPLSWTIARSEGRVGRALETLAQLPIVVPPAVAGVALLLAFGRRGLLASIYPGELALSFTTAAVVMAEVFVSAPFYVQAATSAFRRIDTRVLWVARSLGATPFLLFARIAVPLAGRGLLAGALLSWARALGEFGATLMFAGNLAGRTQTLPLAIYTALESDLRAAQALSIVLVLVAFALLLSARSALRRVEAAS